MATTTMTQPPPTFNTLDARQRVRLLRSTKKIGNVLGTTPYVLEPSEAPDCLTIEAVHDPMHSKSSKQIRRQASLVARRPLAAQHTRTASTSSTTPLIASLGESASVPSTPTTASGMLPATKSFSSRPNRSLDMPIPRPLILQVQAQRGPRDSIMSDTTDAPVDGEGNTLPMTASRTPLTPSFRFRAAAIPEMRRKKMAKLAQQLGETVPPELVFSKEAISEAQRYTKEAASGTAPASMDTQTRKRWSMTVSVGKAIAPVIGKVGAKWVAPAEWQCHKEPEVDEWEGVWNSGDYQDLMSRLRLLRK